MNGSARPHVLIVEARFYDDLLDAMLDGAVAALEEAGATWERVTVPGALEIPAAIRFAIDAAEGNPVRRRFDGFVALGCIIRGETYHFDVVANESARGIMDLTIRHSLAIGNGILTVENDDQAWVRARRTDKDKGGDAARACLAMIGYGGAMT